MPYGGPVLGPSAAHMALLPFGTSAAYPRHPRLETKTAPEQAPNAITAVTFATLQRLAVAHLHWTLREDTRRAFLLFATYQAEVDEAKKDRIALSIYGKTGKLLGRWKCADDWLLMLIAYCAARVRDREELIGFKVAPLLENKGKPQAMNLLSVHTSEPSYSGEGAAPENAGTYQGPLTPGWGCHSAAHRETVQNEEFENLYYHPGYRDID